MNFIRPAIRRMDEFCILTGWTSTEPDEDCMELNLSKVDEKWAAMT
jgi:hypothetical protein